MTMMKTVTRATVLGLTVAALTGFGAAAKDVTINVWSGGSGPNDHYRIDAIKMAAHILEQETAIRGEELNHHHRGQAL